MLPEEAQALMAKMLLIFFGTVMLCLSKVKASDMVIKPTTYNSTQYIAQKL